MTLVGEFVSSCQCIDSCVKSAVSTAIISTIVDEEALASAAAEKTFETINIGFRQRDILDIFTFTDTNWDYTKGIGIEK